MNETGYFVNYCVECEWSASTDNHTKMERAGLVVEHALTTGHDIDSEYREAEEPTTGWVDEWPPAE